MSLSSASPAHEALTFLPSNQEIAGLLGPTSRDECSKTEVSVSGRIARALRDPIADLLTRPSKGFRGQLVTWGYHLSDWNAPPPAETDANRLELCSQVLEQLHAASLVVDDIEDESLVRRGEPALHRKYGLPIALNAGNWLYFWPLWRVREVTASDPQLELEIYRLCHEVLIRAHFGQAIDVGTAMDTVPRPQVRSVCLSSIELKSGALMALALQLGGRVGKASPARMNQLAELGFELGTALQLFDDVGNFAGDGDRAMLGPSAVKRLEDLRLKRPSWIWAVAAEVSASDAHYSAFVNAVNALPDESGLQAWSAQTDLVRRARSSASRYLEQVIERVEKDWGSHLRSIPVRDGFQTEQLKTVEKIRDFAKKLEKSYGGSENSRNSIRE
jgi:geranylgeranyl pyrophosphate synthase